MPEKEYGNLTKDQFRRFVSQLPEVRRDYAEFEEIIRSASPEIFDYIEVF